MAARPEPSPPETLVLARGAEGYPAAALDLDDPPSILFVRGRWPLARPVAAVVGARAATAYGLAVAARLGGDLARLGVTVASGLAHGIDAAAHRGALDAGGGTLAVLPGGLDVVTPPAHRPLAREIERRGTLLSERPAGSRAWKSAFLERNRLIAALARVVVVVEARERSGALNTARHARRLGRVVLAVPGDVDRETSRGTNALLRGGAGLCEGVADVIAALESASSAGRAAPVRPVPEPADAGGIAVAAAAGAGRGTPASRLIAALGDGPRTAEDCARTVGVPLPEALAALLELEWSGLARRRPGGRWERRTPAR